MTDIIEDFTDEQIREIAANPDKFLALSNKQRLKFVLDFINTYPEKYDQMIWGSVQAEVGFEKPTPELSCGTTACIAGWASILGGARPYISEYAREDIYGRIRFDDVITPAGRASAVYSYAYRTLGISSDDADILFDEYNTREGISRMIENLIEDRPIRAGFDNREED